MSELALLHLRTELAQDRAQIADIVADDREPLVYGQGLSFARPLPNWPSNSALHGPTRHRSSRIGQIGKKRQRH